jgi:RNA polymerase sigma factor (sigma-70 family)
MLAPEPPAVAPCRESTVVSRPLAEEQLVERARRGDKAAYEELVVAYQGLAFRTAYLIARDAADAEEAAQDGFVKAYRALGRFHAGAPFRPWLLAIVANEAKNRRRSSARRAALVLQEVSDDAAPSPETVLLAGEGRTRLLAAVESLREEERDAVVCRYFLELSEEETAAALGVRLGTVKSRTHRALAHLKEAIG